MGIFGEILVKMLWNRWILKIFKLRVAQKILKKITIKLENYENFLKFLKKGKNVGEIWWFWWVEFFWVIFLVKCGEMGGLTYFFLAHSEENFEKVTVKGGEIGDFFEWNRWKKLWKDFVK